MLTSGAINNLLRISSSNITDTIVDFNLQIITLNLQSNKNNYAKDFDLYTCSLGDTNYSYSGFILPIIKDKQNIKRGDIIKITKISTSKLTYNGCKIIIVKKYEVIKKEQPIENNMINVESYDDIQNKIKEEKRKEPKIEESLNTNKIHRNDFLKNKDNSNINTNLFDNKNKEEINIINPDEVDMKTILALSQISTFSKNICLYVKLTRKFPIKNFFNKITNKESRLLSFDLIDTSGFEMQGFIFDNCIEKFSSILEENNIYYIKGGYAKFNDKKFTNIKADYRLIFDYNTQIKKVNKNLDKYFDKEDEKLNKLNIIKFSNLNNCKLNQTINCLGYVLQIFPVLSKSSRIGNVLMRKLFLFDSSLYKVQFTLWNKFTELNLNKGDIVLLQNIRVGNFGGNICLSTIDNSKIETISDVSQSLKEYVDLKDIINKGINEEDIKYITTNENKKENGDLGIRSLYNNNIIHINSLIKDLENKFNNSSQEEVSEFFTIKATVLEFEHGAKNYYLGCKYCRKKLIQKDNNYFCPSCETVITDFNYYYILTLRVIDITGEHSLNLFGEQVNNLFGMDARTYSNLIENNQVEKLKDIKDKIEYHSFYFQGKANIFKYGNRNKTQLFVYKFEKEDFNKEKKKIFENINKSLKNI